jgi:hypothetical protein
MPLGILAIESEVVNKIDICINKTSHTPVSTNDLLENIFILLRYIIQRNMTKENLKNAKLIHMNNEERNILKMVVKQGGLLPPVDVINIFAKRDRRPVENLVVKGFLEEVPKEMNGVFSNSPKTTVVFYRATEKGLHVFSPLYIRMWYRIKGDIHTILVSVITTVITFVIIRLLENLISSYV